MSTVIFIHVCMLYGYKKGSSASSVQKNIKYAYGEVGISNRTCQWWFIRFISHNQNHHLISAKANYSLQSSPIGEIQTVHYKRRSGVGRIN